MLPEMETVDENKVASETLGGVSLSLNETDVLGLEKEVSVVKNQENEKEDGDDDVVIVRKTVLEETEVSVVKVLVENKKETNGTIVKNQEKEVQESDQEGVFGNFFGDSEVNGISVKGSFEDASKVQEDKEETEATIVKNQENEVQESDKEGVFGNFVGDGDEDTKAKHNENGVSVKRSFDDASVVQEDKEQTEATIVKNQENEVQETESEEVFGNFVGDDDEDTKAKQDENGVSVKGGDPMEICLSDDKTKKQENGSNQETFKNGEEVEDESEEDEEDHDFITGDFVWGKIKSHPWWPGQIYNPSDASDFAAKFKRRGRLLVAYFGDGSFSWCSPTQLKPFIDHFDEMSKQTNSKNFVNAVQTALLEISRLVEEELLGVDQVGHERVANSGVKHGVFAPKGNTVRFLIDRMGPVEILSILKASAMMGFERLLDLDLELTVVRSCLSAFYKRKGGYFLPVFHEPKCIDGLEDKIRTGYVSGDVNAANSEANGPVENTGHRRKQKSVAELLGEVEENEHKIKKAKTTKDGGLKKRKVPVPMPVVVPPESPESDHESDGDNGSGGGEEELTSPRQRKKSKYLSPPYTNPVWGTRVLGSSSFKELKLDTEKDIDSETGQKRTEDSSVKKPRQKRRSREDSEPKEERKRNIMDVALSASKMLNGLLRTALDPSSTNENKNLTAITEFILSFRSSIFKDGPNGPNDGKNDSVVILVIEFPPGVSLPTKADLLKTYRKFGDVVKKETRVQKDGSCAFVGFLNGSEAEAALNMSIEKKPLGGVKYYLGGDADGSGLGFVKKKVEEMMEMVKKSEEGEMSSEMKAKLEQGMKEVLEKVSKME